MLEKKGLVAFDCNFTARCIRAKFGFFRHFTNKCKQEVKKANFTIGVAGALYYRVPRGAKVQSNVGTPSGAYINYNRMPPLVTFDCNLF